MEKERFNYGVQRGHETPPGDRRLYGTPEAPGAGEERTWSVLAHLSIFLNLFTGFLGPVAAFIIWLVFRDRSRMVATQALQATWYQVAWLVILAVGWTVTGLLMMILIGFLLVPVMFVVSLIPFTHAAYGAYKVSRGEDFSYL